MADPSVTYGKYQLLERIARGGMAEVYRAKSHGVSGFEKVLVIKRIHVVYMLKTGEENRETAVRVHEFHADFCPVARSIRGCIDITTELRFAEEPIQS